ncbi:MAG: P1 family peptidase [Novosphingobium sp.]|jgi:D-aminopeptidase|nr:P1 family peptidase [Novosphingobium sp.]
MHAPKWTFHSFLLLLLVSIPPMTIAQSTNPAAEPMRARDLGVPFDGNPGPLNAITDVPGVEVGHTTLISGNGKLVTGKGPVRTGVTAILPRGKTLRRLVFAQWQRRDDGHDLD